MRALENFRNRSKCGVFAGSMKVTLFAEILQFAQYASAVQQEIYSERLEFLNFNIDIIMINSQ